MDVLHVAPGDLSYPFAVVRVDGWEHLSRGICGQATLPAGSRPDLDVSLPFLRLSLRLFFAPSVYLLQLTDELIALASDDIELIIGQAAPFSFTLPLHCVHCPSIWFHSIAFPFFSHCSRLSLPHVLQYVRSLLCIECSLAFIGRGRAPCCHQSENAPMTPSRNERTRSQPSMLFRFQRQSPAGVWSLRVRPWIA